MHRASGITSFLFCWLMSSLGPSAEGAALSWSASATTVEEQISYPTIPFTWTVTGSAWEQYSMIGKVSDTITVTMDGPVAGGELTAKGSGNASLKYTLYPGQNNSVWLQVSSGPQLVFSKLASLFIETNTVTIPIEAGRTYTIEMLWQVGGPIFTGAGGNATLSYSGLTGTVTQTAYVSATTQGSGFVNGTNGPQTYSFTPPQPSPTHGGTLGPLNYYVYASDSRVSAGLSGTDTFVASTSYSKHDYVTNLTILGERRAITVADGLVILATLPPAVRYQFGGNLPAEYLNMWIEGSTLRAILLKEPVQIAQVAKTQDAVQFTWNSIAGGTYEIQWAPLIGPGATWSPIAEVVASGDVAEYVDNSVLARISGGYWQVVKK